jgi:signal peptide peptidase SppA
MPCTKCEDGKWKWGENGECRYESESACKDAHKGSPHAEESLFGPYPRIATLLFDTPLLIEKSHLNRLMAYLGPKLNVDIPPIQGAYGPSKPQKSYQVIRDSGIIPITGELVHRGSWLDAYSGLTSYQMIKTQLIEAVDDNEIQSIILDIDSPGGSAQAVFDLADLMFELRNEKPIYAVINESAYSAAYALASAATKIYTPRTAGVGSIGVIAQHVDQSQYNEKQGFKVTNIFAGDKKADFSPHEPLSDSAMSTLQDMVNETYSLFVSTVARNRGMSEKAIKDTQAGIFISRSAVKAGLADVVASTDDAFNEIFTFNAKETVSMTTSTKAGSDASKQSSASEENVIDFETRQAIEKSAKADAVAELQARTKEITQLCALGGVPQKAGEFIASDLSIEDIREALINEKAKQDELSQVNGSLPASSKADNYGWGRAVSKANKMNARK